MNQYINTLLKYLLPIFVFGMIAQSLLRIYFVYTFFDDIAMFLTREEDLRLTLTKAFLKGIRYDWIVLSYVFLPPFVWLFYNMLRNNSNQIFYKVISVYFTVVFLLIFALAFVNIPYYNYFLVQINFSVVNWLGFGDTYNMVFQEISYLKYFMLFLMSVAFSSLFCLKLKKWSENSTCQNQASKTKSVLLFLFTFIFLFFGTKGQFKLNSVNRGDAQFSASLISNDAVVSPIYNFVHSVVLPKDFEVNFSELMDSEKAIENVRRYLGVNSNKAFKNPISRQVIGDSTLTQNIVFIYLESMSSDLMFKDANNIRLTPFLDSLTEKSLYFKNFYSSGTHTNNAIGSIISGYPALFDKPTMVRTPLSYKALSHQFKLLDYQTIFFITHNTAFDNIASYFKKNNIDTCFNIEHYPEEKALSGFGVPDDYLYEFSIDKLNEDYVNDKPFFASILTISNHPPYIVPKEYEEISSDPTISVLRYVDNSLKQFMDDASKQSWYDNTIFIIMGDHGKIIPSQKYSMPLSLNHVPFLIFSPNIEPRTVSTYGTQVDVFPTIMGCLGHTYINNTMGVDLLKDGRLYSFFTSDKAMGCIDDQFFYTQNMLSKREYLYDRSSDSVNNVIDKYSSIADSMRQYVSSMLVATEYIIKEGIAEEY